MMYCPRCATRLSPTTTRCPECRLDVQPIAQMLYGADSIVADHSEQHRAARLKRWKRQRHSLGLLLVMCSFLVGCLIPISLGLFSAFSGLSSLIMALAGVAGTLFVLGTMLILASEDAILAVDDDASAVQRTPQVGETTLANVKA